MSSLQATTSQIVLHPFVSQNLKILSTTLGRDKVYRLVQNFARFLAWVLLLRGNKIEAARWNALKSHLALGRKLLRLAKPIEHLQAALRALQAPSENGESLLQVARQLCYFLYLSYDAFVWANTVKFFPLQPSTAARVNKAANRYWLAGILFSITHSLLKAGRLANESKALRAPIMREKSVGDEAQRELQLNKVEAARAATRYQFAMDCIDVWLPAAGAELINASDGFLGVCGMITSYMSLRSQWSSLNPASKSQ